MFLDKTKKYGLLVVPVLLLSGCMSAPRVYDGVLGYEISRHNDVVMLSYTDEARRSDDFVEKRSVKACAQHLDVPISAMVLLKRSSTLLEKDVGMSVPIPVGVVTTGDSWSNPASGKAGANTAQVTHQEQMTRRMKLRKNEYECQRLK